MSAETLDRLYSKFISANRQVTHHPIIDLMLIRNDKNFLPKIPEDSNEFQYFSRLPSLDPTQLQELYKNLQNGKLTDAFNGEFESIFKFDSEFFQSIQYLRINCQKNDSGGINYLLISAFFCWLEFILESSKNAQALSFNSMDLFIREIENYGNLPSPFSTIESYLFSRFIENFINCNSYKLDNDSLWLISHHIKIDETLDHEFSHVFLQLVQKVSDGLYTNPSFHKEKTQNYYVTPEGANNLLETLNIVIEYRRKSLSPTDFQKLSVILVPFIDNLNINAINAISNLSSSLTEFANNENSGVTLPSLKDSFILLPPLLLKKLQKEEEGPFITKDDFPHFDERLYKIELQNQKNHDQDQNQIDEIVLYISDNKYALENGFQPIESEPPIPLNDLLPHNFSKFLLSFSNALKKANGNCIDNFFMAMFKLLDALENSSQLYYELYVCAIFLATTCVEKISLMSLINLFNTKTIFYPELTIFDNKIGDGPIFDSKVRSIRFHVLNLFACQMDQLIPEFLKDTVQFPFLFAEELSFVSNVTHMNLEVFMTKEFVVSIFTVIKSLINDYFKFIKSKENEEQKERVFTALQTILYFLFKLLANKTIEMQYFISNYFISNFFGLVFVDFLKPFILMTMTNFLLDLQPDYSNNYLIIDTVTTYFTHLYMKINKIDFELDKDYKISLIIDITNNLFTALSMNMKLAKFFSKVLDSFLELKSTFPEQLHLGLRFLSLVSSNSSKSINKRMNNNINCIDETKLTSKQLRLVVNLIRKIEGNEPSLATKIILMNLCAASVSLGNNALFLILRPSMIPLLFIAFGESSNSKILEILNMFNDLCDFSESNCIAVHESGIDTILLEFVYNYMINKENVVNFRGINFKLNFNEKDIFNSIFPFLSKIFTISANNVIVNLLNNLICSFEHPDLCNKVASFVLRMLMNQKTKISPTFPLGFKQCPLNITKVTPNIINKSFSFMTWVKVDRPIALQMSQSIPIITISDKSGNKKTNNNIFSLFINRGCLYYQFNDRVELIYQQIQSNTWVFVGFVCQRTTQQMSCIGLFTELSMIYCDDVPAVFFPKELNLTISIGGPFQFDDLNVTDNENKLGVLMGPFALFDKMLDDAVFENVEKQGPSAIDDLCIGDDKKNLILRSINPNIISNANSSSIIEIANEYISVFKVESKTIQYYANLCQNSFERNFCMYEQNLVKLMEVFIRYDEAPQNLVDLIQAIMKQAFDSYIESQSNFVSYFGILKQYLMKHAKESATFRLYKTFYSIFEVMKNQEAANHMFDNLLLNVELYSKGPPKSFERIVKHWGLYLVNNYPSLITRKNFFTRLVKMYVYLFNKKPFDERYKEEDIDRIRINFCVLLEEASKQGLTRENISYFENFINIQTDNERNLFTFLSILERNIGKVHLNGDYQLTLHHFAENENSDISQIAIISIHELTKPNWMKPMMALALQLKAKINKNKNDANMKNSLIKFLLDNAPKYPGFIHLITALTTSFDNNEKQKVANKLKDIYCYGLNSGQSSPFEDVVKDRFWFIWLLIAAIHSVESAQLSFLTLISSFLTYVDDFYSEMNLIVNVLQIFEAVDKTFDYYQIVLDLFININAINISYAKFLIIPLFRALFFKFSEVAYSNEIIQLFVNGPFKDEYLKLKNNSNITFSNDNLENQINHPKYDILSLEPLLVQDYSNYMLNFLYGVDAGNSKSEGKLSQFLIQLIENCKEVQFNKLTANQVISNFLNNNNNIVNSANNMADVKNSSLNSSSNFAVNSSNNFANDESAPLVQTANDISNLIALLHCSNLLEFVHFMIDDEENQTEANRVEQIINFTNILPKIQRKFNHRFLHHIFDNITEIRIIIKEIKKLVFVDFDSVKQNSIENLKNSDFVSQFAKKVTNLEARKFASNFIKYSNTSKRIQCRQSNLSLVYCPVKMEIEPEKLEIEEFFKPINKRSASNHNQEIAFKSKLHEFGIEKEIEIVIVSNDLIKIYENASSSLHHNNDNGNHNLFVHSLIKSISFSKIDFIITREKNCLEIFTSQQGSYFIEFANNQDFIKCSSIFSLYFSPLSKFINNENPKFLNENSKILVSILNELSSMKYNSSSDSQLITNFEYLMMLNYFSGYSFHKSGKIPRIPFNGQPFSAQRFFLPEFFISKVMSSSNDLSGDSIDSSCTDPLYVYQIRHQLEENDVQQIAKKKYRFFVPKTVTANKENDEGPIKQKCYRDLKLEQGKIVAGGFIDKCVNKESFNESDDLQNLTSRTVFIVTKDGEVHFVDILRNKLKHYRSFTSNFLKENIITTDKNDDKNYNDYDDSNCFSIVNSGDGFLAICNKMAQRFTPTFESQVAETTMEPPLISISGREIVFVTNGCDVKKCVKPKLNQNLVSLNLAPASSTAILSSTITTAKNNSPSLSSIASSSSAFTGSAQNSLSSTKKQPNDQSIQQLFELVSTSNSRITCISCSIKFSVIVYGTEKCQLFVFSLGSEKVLHSIIDLNVPEKAQNDECIKNEPQKVLVTSGWGFIVTEAQRSIFVHTVNGTLIGAVKIENIIVDWCSATNKRGEDFVIFIDTDSQIGIFEAAKLTKNCNENNIIKFIKGQPGTIALTYNNEFECIVTLARKDGVLAFLPMPLDDFQ